MADEPAHKPQPSATPAPRQVDPVPQHDAATQRPQPQPDQTHTMPHPFNFDNFQSRANTATAVAPDPLGYSSPHDVLTVDDDPEINELIGAYVELASYSCRRVARGADALTTGHDNPPSFV